MSTKEEHLLEKNTDQHLKAVCDNETNDRCGNHPSDETRVNKSLGHGQDSCAYTAFKQMHEGL